MKRRDILLAALSTADRPFQPVHLQKALFLVDDKLPHLFTHDQRYGFQPYDYGPFDQAVYADADILKAQGLVHIDQEPGQPHRTYAVTDAGREQGGRILRQMQQNDAGMIARIVGIVTKMSFRELVSSIYRAYPHMKVNSVFKEPA